MSHRESVSPIQATTTEALCAMPRDNIDIGKEHWFMVDVGVVTLTRQEAGKAAQASITLPRREFNQLVRWYLTGSKKGALPDG